MKQRPIFTARRPRAVRGSSWVLPWMLLSLLMLALPALSITLIDNNATDYVIAKQTGCDTTTSSAATDIQTYLKNISGGVATIPIYSYADMSTVPTKAIIIGDLVTSPTLALEEIAMTVSGERLILRGGSSLAHRYAVFTFLEEELGCRYYAPTVEYLPSIGTITVANDYDETRSPSFEHRYLYQQDVTASGSADWCVKNRVNGAVTIYGGHNMYTAVPPATYFASHPEYYPLKSGNRTYNTYNQWLCFTNPDLPQIIATYVNGRMAVTDANTIVNIGQGDWSDSCECASCQAAYAAEGNAWSGVMLGCLNAAADIVAQSYPTRKMMTFAYMHTEKPPSSTAPRSNLLIRLCHWRRCDLHGLDECSKQDPFETNLAGWQNLTTPAQLYIWEYGNSFSSPLAVWPNVEALIPNMQYYHSHDVRGMFYQGVYWARGGDMNWLKMYMLAKVLWDKDVNATTVYNDFLTGYYGAAADEMDAYISYLEDRTRAINWHPDTITCTLDTLRATLLPEAVFTEVEGLYDDAEAAASAVSQTLLDRVQYDRASLLLMRLYNKQQFSRISTPEDRLVKLGDNRYYDWKELFFSILGNRGVGNEYCSTNRSVQDLKALQAGELVTLENDDVKLTVCPGLQGSIISLIDKRTDYELLHPSVMAYDSTAYPYNGYFWTGVYNATPSLYGRNAASSVDLTTDQYGTQHLTVVCDTGMGAWTPSTNTHRMTQVYSLPEEGAEFTTKVYVKNLAASTYTNEHAAGNLALAQLINYTDITAMLANDSTAVITTFPTTYNVKQIEYSNGKHGVKLTQSFDEALSTVNLTVKDSPAGMPSTLSSQYKSGLFDLEPNEEALVMDTTWSLSEIPVVPVPENLIWTDFRYTKADYSVDSTLIKFNADEGGTNAWNADAISAKRLLGNCYVEWKTPNESNVSMGLATTNVNAGLSIKYAIRLNSDGTFIASENGTAVSATQAKQAGAFYRVERVGTTVYYKVNGNTFHTSSVSSSGALLVDCCIYARSHKLSNCRIFADSYYEPPVVTLTAPDNGMVYAPGATINLHASASTTDGSTISKVEFYQGSTYLGEDETSPYAFDWTNVPSGSYTLTAKAIDSDEGTTVSSGVAVRVNTLPTVSITSPEDEEEFTTGDNITITVNAADSDGTISKVEFFQGTTKLGEDSTSPYSYYWEDVAAGSYTLTTKAIDNDSGTTTSDAVAIDVQPPNSAPTVSITSPEDEAEFDAGDNITITATAADSDGTISKVEFYQGTTKLGEDSTSPYSYYWEDVAAGSYTLTAKAFDDDDASTVSGGVSIEVSVSNAPPSVTLTAPANNAVIIGDTVSFTAEASDTDGTISKVEFYHGTTKVGEDSTSPYAYDWTDVVGGGFALTARAIDDDLAETASFAAAVTVWNTGDIGSVGGTGSASYNSGTGVYTVNGAGAGMTSTADAFRFVYQRISGDCTIIARVVTSAAGYSSARAGVQIRETLDVGSKHASSLYMKYSGRVYRPYRSATDGTTSTANVSNCTLPRWVKLVRSGNTFTMYHSADGSSWTQVSTAPSITMSDPVYIGLAVNSGESTVRAVTFDNVSITTQ